MTSTIEERLHIPRYVVLSLLAAFVIMAIFALIASQNPDGLERMFETIGVESAEGGFLGFGEGIVADILTMAVGMVIVFALIIILMYLLRYFKGR